VGTRCGAGVRPWRRIISARALESGGAGGTEVAAALAKVAEEAHRQLPHPYLVISSRVLVAINCILLYG
jgi:hypothetical protein